MAASTTYRNASSKYNSYSLYSSDVCRFPWGFQHSVLDEVLTVVLNFASAMATNGRKQSQASVSAPRTLNVQKFAESRASELDSLHSIVSKRFNNDFRSQRNKRRRTTGYDNRATKNRGRKKQKIEVVENKSKALNAEFNQKKVPRHVRRRAELIKNPQNGFCRSGDGTKRLRTHVWHAKRFTMTKLWGFHLPLGLQGRGRGSRALLKLSKHEALVHDASYFGAVQLEGAEDSLLSVLKMVLVPSPSSLSEDLFHSVLSGVVYGNAVLHRVGAPVPQSIAPITYIWRPVHQQNTGVDTEGPNSNERDGHQSVKCPSSVRQLWVWVHGAAFSEGYDTLKSACVQQMNENGILINCMSLEDQLAKLEVLGSKSFQLLQKILHPVTCFPNTWQLNKCSVAEADTKTHLCKSSILEIEDHLSSHAIISLTVDDPRTLHKTRTTIAPEATPTNIISNILEDEKNATLTEIPQKVKDVASSLCLKHEEIGNPASNLWDANNGISPPMEENFLCMEKHLMRLDSFCLGDTNSGTQYDSAKAKSSISCPIMLLNDTNQKGSFIRWSIILPMSWVKAFWAHFVSNGAHAIGLREKHWVACEAGFLYFPSDLLSLRVLTRFSDIAVMTFPFWQAGLPYFPSDFADSSGYSYFKATEAAASDQKAESRLLAVRPLRVPIPPPWSCVRLAFDEVFTRVGEFHSCENLCCEDVVSENVLTNSNCQNCDIASVGHHALPFEGFVPRTSNMLTNFLNGICGDHLLLLPFEPDRKTSFSKFTKEEINLSRVQNRATQLLKDRKLCFLRIILHAYREGAFEEGAIVCAPRPTDITLWTSRSENNGGELQIPQSSANLYFKEQFSGIWKLNSLDDPIFRESHRWPIGFVTSGFARGSKKPTAGALCEATLLARVREEQWLEMPTKKRRKEIYVLVRNLRSTAYRLALATTVLEKQEEGMEFM